MRHTRHLQKPERGFGSTTGARKVQELDIAREQRTVRAPEGENASGLVFSRILRVDKAREPERHLRARELARVRQGLPERRGARRCECGKREAHDARRVAVEQALGHLVHDEERLRGDRETAHVDRVLPEHA